MNTPAHAVVNLVLLGRGKEVPQIPIFIGSILPDAPMFLFYFLHKVVWHTSENQIWSQAYFLPQWQNFFDISNSIPLIVAGLAFAWMMHSKWLGLLFLSMLFHVFFDLPLHRDDAHRHLFPFTDWKFVSPVSYWDSDHYGDIVSMIEITVVIVCCIVLFIRHKHLMGRLAVGAVASVYVGYIAYVFMVWGQDAGHGH